MLRETARKGYPDPEEVDNHMIAPQDYDVRQSGRVLEIQNRDLWIPPTDLSWHIPILVTSVELQAREDKIEEAKKQNTLTSKVPVLDCQRPFHARSMTFVEHSFSCLFGSRPTCQFALVRFHLSA